MTKLPIQSGNIYTAVEHETRGPGSYSGLHNTGAKGPITIHGVQPSGPSNFFRINDGCSDLLFDGLEFTGLWRNWITAAQRAVWRNCHFHHNRMEGIILGACSDCVIEDSVAEFCGPQYMTGYADSSHHEPSADHAYYISYGGENNTLRRCIAQHVSGCGLHTYGNGDEGTYQRNLVGEDLAFLYCGSEGTPCIQPDGTRDSHLSNVLIAHSEVGGWTWDAGDGMPCRNWLIEKMTMWNADAKFNIHIAPGTSGIVYRDSIFVLCDAPLCESTEGGEPDEWPHFENCLIYAQYGLPRAVYSGNTIRDLEEAEKLFPRALKGDFAPTDPAVPGFRDWRNQPPPVEYIPCPSCVGHVPAYPAGKVPKAA